MCAHNETSNKLLFVLAVHTAIQYKAMVTLNKHCITIIIKVLTHLACHAAFAEGRLELVE